MADETALERRQPVGALATEAPSNPWSSAGLLKPYAGGIVTEAPKVDALATVTAGYKTPDGWPAASKDGTIYVRGEERAPGLVAELERRGKKSLTIALVHNDPKDVLQQWFAAYSKTRLEARGDEHEVTIIHLRDTGKKDRQNKAIMEPVREVVRRDQDPERYAALVGSMKVQTSLYFCLAEWDGQEPRLVFPDGLGLYRLHFTSLNSAEAIKAQLSYIASLTGGRVAGVPLELSIAYRNLAGPDGSRRDRVPIWSLVLKPPETIKLSPSVVASILQSGLDQARSLAIAAPRPETLELAEAEGPDIDLDDARIVEGQAVAVSQRDVNRLAGGGAISNPNRYCQLFMMAAKGSSIEDRTNRQQFMIAATRGRYDSLSTFAFEATHDEGAALMVTLADWLREEVSARQDAAVRGEDVAPRPASDRPIRTYEELYGSDEDGAVTPPSEQPRVAPTSSSPDVLAAAAMTGAPPIDPPRPEEGKPYTRAQWGAMYVAWVPVLQRYEPSWTPAPVDQLANGSLKAAVIEILGLIDNARAAIAAYDEEDIEDPSEELTVSAF